jgi:hypothetical protein
MTDIELKQCLATLHWSTLTLAQSLGVDVGTVVDWYFGRADVPNEVSMWLTTLAEAMERYPAPDLGRVSDSAYPITDFDFSSVGATAVPR